MEYNNITPEYIASVRRIIGGWLREFREEKKLTQQQVGGMIGVSKYSINKIESGAWISLEIIIKLSTCLDFYIFLCKKDSSDELDVTMRSHWRHAHGEN